MEIVFSKSVAKPNQELFYMKNEILRAKKLNLRGVIVQFGGGSTVKFGEGTVKQKGGAVKLEKSTYNGTFYKNMRRAFVKKIYRFFIRTYAKFL